MDIASLFLILFSTLINFIDGIVYIIGNSTGYFFPDIVSISISVIQVLLLLVATILAIINCFTNKVEKKLKKFLLLAISSALFFANLNWLITWI